MSAALTKERALKAFLDKHSREITNLVNAFYKQLNAPMQYGKLFARYGTFASKHSISIGDIAEACEEAKLIHIVLGPLEKRLVFPYGTAGGNMDDLFALACDYDRAKDAEREMARLTRRRA